MRGTLYLLSGLSLVIALAVTIVYYYSRKRHKKVEEPKYRMLDDD
jgi:hypothetical protein